MKFFDQQFTSEGQLAKACVSELVENQSELKSLDQVFSKASILMGFYKGYCKANGWVDKPDVAAIVALAMLPIVAKLKAQESGTAKPEDPFGFGQSDPSRN